MKRTAVYMFCFLIAYNVCAQEQNPITINDNVNSYFNTVKEYSVIYTGKEEPKYANSYTNHPYLNTDAFRRGLVSFDGRTYPDVLLRLNQNKEELVTMSPDNRFAIIIPRDRVDYAVIDSQLILYHKPESADGSLLPQGFYVRTYDGDCQVWKRELYFQTSKVTDYQVEYFFKENARIYIYKNGIYHPVNSKKSVLKLFDSNKKELKSYIKMSQIKFRNNPESAIVAVTKYYDELNK